MGWARHFLVDLGRRSRVERTNSINAILIQVCRFPALPGRGTLKLSMSETQFMKLAARLFPGEMRWITGVSSLPVHR
ncbi:hypothetical protein AHAS_Ahas06G0251600 [Arachis hypogaea]